jgi:hypothetical protein
MKEWTVEFGSKVLHVDADTAEDAINAAYLEIGYDPDDEVFVYCEEEDA